MESILCTPNTLLLTECFLTLQTIANKKLTARGAGDNQASTITSSARMNVCVDYVIWHTAAKGQLVQVEVCKSLGN